MLKRILIVLVVLGLTLAMVGTAFADQPPGNQGGH